MAAKKTIQNRQSKLTRNTKDGLVEMSYFDLIKLSFDVIPKGQSGFSRDDINKRNRIERKLNVNVGDEVELEHDEFYFIKKTCNDMPWQTRHEEVEIFLDYLDDVK